MTQTSEHKERRRLFLQNIYNEHNSTATTSKAVKMPRMGKSLLVPSSTADAASRSFIRDSSSPLFHAQPAPEILKALNPLKAKSFTVTPTNSPKASSRALKFETKLKTPKKIKKPKAPASREELCQVLEHFALAQQKDIEGLLRTHEPEVLAQRDAIYASAAASGLSADSSCESARLSVLGRVVAFAFAHIEPPNEYTKLTDRRHFREVAAWTAKMAKDRGVRPELALIFSAWCHDIERFIPCTKCAYLPESVDKYRKQVIHGVTSARGALCLLKGAPVTQREKDRVFELILRHDIPNPRM